MDCFYINLESAKERNKNLIDNFKIVNNHEWNLKRFNAIDKNFIIENEITGSLSYGQKGCFLSHQKIIELSSQNQETVFILEDDAFLGTHTQDIVINFIQAYENIEWDIAYTDICIPKTEQMIEFSKIREYFSSQNQIGLIDLAMTPFAGSTAYLINGKSKRRITEKFSELSSYDIPYDIYLANLIHSGELKALFFLPFITSLQPNSDDSQINNLGLSGPDRIWNSYRRLMFNERILNSCEKEIDEIFNTHCNTIDLMTLKLIKSLESHIFQ